MSYTDALESKHHYLMILKDSDASRRAIERNYTPDKAAEHKKIMAIRNTAFINLIKEGVPFVEDREKNVIRIKIDDMAYDMKKDKLRDLVGEQAFEKILSVSHAHEQNLRFLEDNHIEAQSDSSFNPNPGMNQGMNMNSIPNANFGQIGMNQYPPNYGMMPPYGYAPQPMVMPYPFMIPQMPAMMPQQQDTSKIDNVINALNERLNEISEKMKPEVKEVVVDDRLKQELKEAKDKEQSALEAIKDIRTRFDAEKMRREVLEGDFEAIVNERDSLKAQVESAQSVTEIEQNELKRKINELEKEKVRLMEEANENADKIRNETEEQIKKEKALLKIELEKERSESDRRIREVEADKQKELDRIKSEFAQKNEDYEKKLLEAEEKIKEIKLNMVDESEEEKNEAARKIEELKWQISRVTAERDKAQENIEKIKQLSKDKIKEAQEEANRRIEEIQKTTSGNAENTDAVIEKIQQEAEQKIKDAQNNANLRIKELEKQVAESKSYAKDIETKLSDVKQQSNERIAQIEKTANENIRELESRLNTNDSETDQKIQEIMADSQKQIDAMKAELAKKEQEFKVKESESAEKYEQEMKRKLSEIQSKYDKRQTELIRQHKEDVEEKTAALESAREKIEESSKQINLLNESLKVHKELAFYDTLTGLKNKNAFNREFGKIEGQYIYASIGIRGMKQINEQGREFGNNVIKFVASEIKSQLGEQAYRLIGDGFGVIFTEPKDIAVSKCRNLAIKLREENSITIVYGLSEKTSEKSPKEVIKEAEDALNTMKKEYSMYESRQDIQQSYTENVQEEQEQQPEKSVPVQNSQNVNETIEQRNQNSSFINYTEIRTENGQTVSKKLSEDDYESIMANVFADESPTDKEPLDEEPENAGYTGAQNTVSESYNESAFHSVNSINKDNSREYNYSSPDNNESSYHTERSGFTGMYDSSDDDDMERMMESAERKKVEDIKAAETGNSHQFNRALYDESETMYREIRHQMDDDDDYEAIMNGTR